MKYGSFTIVLMLITVTSYAQEYFTNPEKNTISRMGAGGQGAIQVHGKVFNVIKFDPSTSGSLLYIEDLRTSHESLGLDKVTLKLHVVDRQGKDQVVVPISEKHNHRWNNAYFESDQIVFLVCKSRQLGDFVVTAINLWNGKVYTWERTEYLPSENKTNFKYDYIGKSISPDGRHFIFAVSDLQRKQDLLFLDGKLIFPIFEEQPSNYYIKQDNGMTTNTPNQFQDKIANIPCARKFGLNSQGHGAWSKDGRYLVITQADCATYRNATSGEKPCVLILDTQKITLGKDYRDYAICVPYQAPQNIIPKLQAQAKKHAQSTQSQSSLYANMEAAFSDQDSKIILNEHGEDAPLSFDVLLPSGWRTRTIRQDATQ